MKRVRNGEAVDHIIDNGTLSPTKKSIPTKSPPNYSGPKQFKRYFTPLITYVIIPCIFASLVTFSFHFSLGRYFAGPLLEGTKRAIMKAIPNYDVTSGGGIVLSKVVHTVQREICRNTVQGPNLLSDDKGFTCQYNHLNFRTGCCPKLSQNPVSAPALTSSHPKYLNRFMCDSCNGAGCCHSYEYCVSCCLSLHLNSTLEDLRSMETNVPTDMVRAQRLADDQIYNLTLKCDEGWDEATAPPLVKSSTDSNDDSYDSQEELGDFLGYLEARDEVRHDWLALVHDPFDYCSAKCRTSSVSLIYNQNAYRDSTSKYCYGHSRPILIPANSYLPN